MEAKNMNELSPAAPSAFRMAPTHPRRQDAAPVYWQEESAPEDESQGMRKDIHLCMEGIAPGEKVQVMLPRIDVGHFTPSRMIYSGSRDLWLMGDSIWGQNQNQRVPVCLDTFRSDGDSFFDWGKVVPHYDHYFMVENKSTMRNARPATFAARLIGVWYQPQPNSYQYNRLRR